MVRCKIEKNASNEIVHWALFDDDDAGEIISEYQSPDFDSFTIRHRKENHLIMWLDLCYWTNVSEVREVLNFLTHQAPKI